MSDVIQVTVPTDGDVIAAVLPQPTVVQQTGGGGAVASVFGRTGTVTAQTGDYTAAQVGADTTAARDTAISTATAPLATSSALTTGLAGKQPIDTDLTTIAALDSAQAGVVASDGAGWIRKTYSQLKTALSITAADVGADTSTARDTAISTAINNLINSAPGTLDTLGEIAAALQADESTAAALATTVAGKQPLDADLTAIAALDASTAGAIASDGAGWVKKTYAQFKTALGLVKADVGLGNVDNTSDVNKPVSTAQQTALNGKADLSGPGATVPRNQLPNVSGSFWQQVANQAAMLALTAPDADTALVVFRTDTPGTVWFLNPGLNPATLGNWGSYQDDAAGAAAAAQTAAQSFATSAIATQHTTDNGLYAPIAGPFAPSSTGATAATRYVGGTVSGPPTSGTFTTGDWVTSQDGNIYVCTAGGTSGTWVQSIGAGQVLAGPVQWPTASGTLDFFSLATGASWTDITTPVALSLAVPASSSRPVIVRAMYEVNANAGTAVATTVPVFAQLRLVDSTAATIYSIGGVTFYSTGSAGAQKGRIVLEAYLAAPVSAVTLKIQGNINAAKPTNWTNCVLNPGYGIGGIDNFYAVAG